MYLTFEAWSQKFQSELEELYSKREIDGIFFESIFVFESLSKSDFYLNKKELVGAKLELKLENTLSDLKKHKPIQYITKTQLFLGLELKVGTGVLIPRPETEELVEWIASEIPDKSTIWEIGTGSGCIALGLKSLKPETKIIATDISNDALIIAQKNANLLGMGNIVFKQHDVFKPIKPFLYDVIVSNPPYIAKNEIKKMSPNVVDYEPHEALFVDGDDVLVFYNRILNLGRNHLKNSGIIYFEIHEDYKSELQELCEKMGYSECKFKKDLQGKWRMAKVRF